MKRLAWAAVIASVALFPSAAVADPIGVSVIDPSECLPGSVCGPDIQRASAIYDPVTGFVDVTVTFYAALPSQAGVTPRKTRSSSFLLTPPPAGTAETSREGTS